MLAFVLEFVLGESGTGFGFSSELVGLGVACALGIDAGIAFVEGFGGGGEGGGDDGGCGESHSGGRCGGFLGWLIGCVWISLRCYLVCVECVVVCGVAV